MCEYPKIQTLFKRDPENNHETIIPGNYSRFEFYHLRNIVWEGFEKIDGQNIRVLWDGTTVSFRGRTDKTGVPGFLLDTLSKIFDIGVFIENQIPPLCLYGEGYGYRINNGGDYLKDSHNFILFDIIVTPYCGWLLHKDVFDIAETLGIATAPKVITGTLDDMVSLCENGFSSYVNNKKNAEGLVIKPRGTILYNTEHGRIITKLKSKDFKKEYDKK